MSETPQQPIPRITDEDVERILRRDFALSVQEQVRAALARYGSEPWEREPPRVRLAILRLAHFVTLRLEIGGKLGARDGIVLDDHDMPGRGLHLMCFNNFSQILPELSSFLFNGFTRRH